MIWLLPTSLSLLLFSFAHSVTSALACFGFFQPSKPLLSPDFRVALASLMASLQRGSPNHSFSRSSNPITSPSFNCPHNTYTYWIFFLFIWYCLSQLEGDQKSCFIHSCFPCIILMGHPQDVGYGSLRHSRRGWRFHQLKSYVVLPQYLLILSSKYFSIPTLSFYHQRDGAGTKVSSSLSNITSVVSQLVSLPSILSLLIHSASQFPQHKSDVSPPYLTLFKSSQ